MTDETTLTLAHPGDVYNFALGQPLTIARRHGRLKRMVVAFLRRIRVLKPEAGHVVVAIDAEQGTITLARWER